MKPITNVELFSLVYYTIIKNSNIRFPVDKQNTKIATYVKLLQLKNKKIEKKIVDNWTNEPIEFQFEFCSEIINAFPLEKHMEMIFENKDNLRNDVYLELMDNAKIMYDFKQCIYFEFDV